MSICCGSYFSLPFQTNSLCLCFTRNVHELPRIFSEFVCLSKRQLWFAPAAAKQDDGIDVGGRKAAAVAGADVAGGEENQLKRIKKTQFSKRVHGGHP